MQKIIYWIQCGVHWRYSGGGGGGLLALGTTAEGWILDLQTSEFYMNGWCLEYKISWVDWKSGTCIVAMPNLSLSLRSSIFASRTWMSQGIQWITHSHRWWFSLSVISSFDIIPSLRKPYPNLKESCQHLRFKTLIHVDVFIVDMFW